MLIRLKEYTVATHYPKNSLERLWNDEEFIEHQVSLHPCFFETYVMLAYYVCWKFQRVLHIECSSV